MSRVQKTIIYAAQTNHQDKAKVLPDRFINKSVQYINRKKSLVSMLGEMVSPSTCYLLPC